MAAPKKERIPSYLQDVLASASIAASYVDSIHDATVLDDENNQDIAVNAVRDGIVRRLEIIGQALDNVQKADPDFAAVADLNIAEWYGLRSKISHGYDIVDYGILVMTIRRDLPQLVDQVQALLARSFDT